MPIGREREKVMEKKTPFLNVTKLTKGQTVELPGGKSFVAENDELSIYIPEDVTLHKGDKLYINAIAKDKQKYNQTHYVKIQRKK